eukprot:2805155-Rhodomonas_salina.1
MAHSGAPIAGGCDTGVVACIRSNMKTVSETFPVCMSRVVSRRVDRVLRASGRIVKEAENQQNKIAAEARRVRDLVNQQHETENTKLVKASRRR